MAAAQHRGRQEMRFRGREAARPPPAREGYRSRRRALLGIGPSPASTIRVVVGALAFVLMILHAACPEASRGGSDHEMCLGFVGGPLAAFFRLLVRARGVRFACALGKGEWHPRAFCGTVVTDTRALSLPSSVAPPAAPSHRVEMAAHVLLGWWPAAMPGQSLAPDRFSPKPHLE